MFDYRLSLMAGVDIPIPELQLTIHAPTVKDIAYMGETNYFSAVQYLCLDKEQLIQDKVLLSSLTNFQVLMKVLEAPDNREKKNYIIMLLKLLFPSYVATITPNSILLMFFSENKEENRTIIIDDNNFDLFQSILKEILCVNSMFQGENIIYNPKGKRAKAIADKIMWGRKRAAELKAQAKGESVLTRYLSIITVGIQSMDLRAAADLNMFQLFDLMERYTAYVEWDTDLRVRLAGGKPDKQVESWMRDMHSKTNETPNIQTKAEPTNASNGVQFRDGKWVNI